MNIHLLAKSHTYRRIGITSVLIAGLFAPVGHAEMFKWVDEQGNIHYSDKQPGSDAHSSENIATDEAPEQIASRKANQESAIALPHGRHSHQILIPEIHYHWQSPAAAGQNLKLGAYYLGTLCSPRGPIRNPDVYASHAAFFPAKIGLSKSVNKVFKDLGYQSLAVLTQDLPIRLDANNGLELMATIETIDIQTCAPQVNSLRYLDADEVAVYRFNKNRIKLSINWQLKRGKQGQVLLQTQTDGYSDEWKSNSSVAATLKKAVENATNNLLADKRLINKLSMTTAEYATLAKNNPTSENENPAWQNSMTQFIPFLQNDNGSNGIQRTIQANTLIQSHLASVLAEISSVKVMMVQHYMHDGQWPLNKEAIGLNDSMFASHKLISDLRVRYDGSIHVDLKQDVFGDSKILQLSPNSDAYKKGQSLNINWSCISNLDVAVLPGSCEAI